MRNIVERRIATLLIVWWKIKNWIGPNENNKNHYINTAAVGNVKSIEKKKKFFSPNCVEINVNNPSKIESEMVLNAQFQSREKKIEYRKSARQSVENRNSCVYFVNVCCIYKFLANVWMDSNGKQRLRKKSSKNSKNNRTKWETF